VHSGIQDASMTKTVRAPAGLEAIFEKAEELVARYFSDREHVAERGSILIGGERYLLVRAGSMSVEFFELVEALYGSHVDPAMGPQAFEVARNILFDVAHAMGRADARAFAARMGLQTPQERLAAGPVHFAHAGWASVELLDDSAPEPNDDYVIYYDHPDSFESHAWAQVGKSPPGPVCVMNAGYSAGWCGDAYGITLSATEISCKALGHDSCRFVMAPPHRLEERVRTYIEANPSFQPPAAGPQISGYLEERMAEEALRQREAQYRAVFEGVSDALVVFDRGGFVAQANPEATRLFGCSLHEIEGGDLDALVGRPGFSAELERRVDAHAHHTERVEMNGGGGTAPRYLDVRASAIRHRGRDRLLAIFHDNTEVESARRALQRVNDSLEARTRELHEANTLLRELNEDLLRARDQAVAASRAKSSFLARMSHEFRTPLTAVIGYTELMQEEYADALPDDCSADLGHVISSAGHLLTLINEVLDIAKIEAGEMTVSVETFSLEPFFQSVVDTIRPVADQRGNTISLSIDTSIQRICSDQIKLRQVALNLMSNAVKFTENGRVSLSVTVAHAGDDDLLEFTVSDTGIGIAREQREQLFEPFRQADESTTRRYGGTGLGLSISQAFVRLMGGTIELESALGEGSAFTVRVPVWVLPADRRSVDA
jgi:PAS domain S-box-containing protein